MRIHKRLIDLHSPSEIVKQIVSVREVNEGGGAQSWYRRFRIGWSS